MRKETRAPGKSRAARYVLGRRLGEKHHRATLTDHEVDLIRQLREEDPPMPYRDIADKFEISVITARKIVAFERRQGLTVEDFSG